MTFLVSPSMLFPFFLMIALIVLQQRQHHTSAFEQKNALLNHPTRSTGYRIPFVGGRRTTRSSIEHERSEQQALSSSTCLYMVDDEGKTEEKEKEGVQEYRNVATQFLSLFMQKDDEDGGSTSSNSKNQQQEEKEDPLSDIDFSAPKLKNRKGLTLETLAQCLDYELYNTEWFVTGKCNPMYFDDTFKFEDPDVKLDGIESYSKGVRTIFDQSCSRAEIISTEVNTDVPNTITVTWRLSGKANIGPGLTLKPFIVYTDFKVDPTTMLIVFQRDRFDLPQWDILLSALLPFLIGKVTSPPAPPVQPRTVPMPKILSSLSSGSSSTTTSASSSPFDALTNIFNTNKS